ncbi:MAG: glycosyltransferase [Solirubrobacteraceae bacterium]
MILFLHHRYRTSGGEEQAVQDLLWLVREHLGEEAEMLERRSEFVGRTAAAAGLIGGGLRPEEVAAAVRRTGARIVHAHNLHPTFGWRSLAAARSAGADVVMHLHQYRLVCAIGVCFRDGAQCTRCHGRNTLPGIVLNCRGSRVQAFAYGAGLMLWQRRMAAQAAAFVVPSSFAHERLLGIGAPIGRTFVVPNVTREPAGAPRDRTPDGPALLAARLVPEKGIETAIEACRIAGVPLVVAGEGPERARLQDGAGTVTFAGRLEHEALSRLRAAASVELVPSLAAETFGLAAAEAMAAGLPVAASRVGALPELVPEEWLAPPGDPRALAAAITAIRGDPVAGAKALARARARTSPLVVAPALADVYAHVRPVR